MILVDFEKTWSLRDASHRRKGIKKKRTWLPRKSGNATMIVKKARNSLLMGVKLKDL